MCRSDEVKSHERTREIYDMDSWFYQTKAMG